MGSSKPVTVVAGVGLEARGTRLQQTSFRLGPVRTQRVMLLLVYVDDFVIAAKRADDINEFLSSVQSYWKLSEMGAQIQF